jgi:acyl carrier protein
MARALSTISARTALIRLSWLMIFEEEFHCQITDDDAAKILTVGDAVKFLEENATT